MGGAATPRNASSWRYARGDADDVVDCGYWLGSGVQTLRAHFHDEAQITIVLAGHRTFWIDGEVVTVGPDQVLVIPAGLVHASIGNVYSPSAFVNLYVNHEDESKMHRVLDPGRPDPFMVPPVATIAELLRSGMSSPAARADAHAGRLALQEALLASTGQLREVAAEFDLSREGFSRRARRELHLPPHTFRLLSRLNHARRLLRGADPISVVAAEAGFADQSHLTRLFRQAFGTTPALYKKG